MRRLILPTNGRARLPKNPRSEQSVWHSPAERHRYATRRAEPWSTARPRLGASTGLSHLLVRFQLFPFDGLLGLSGASPYQLCGVSNDALQMVIKKLDRAFLDLYPQRGVQHHVGRTGDRQELERAARFFESIHQFEAVPKINVIVSRAVDKK
jgi:hypothetical protein